MIISNARSRQIHTNVSNNFSLIHPVCLGGFVDYFSHSSGSNTTLNDAYWYALGIISTSVFYLFTYHPFNLFMFKSIYKMRVACSGLIYQKALRIPKSSSEDGQTGKIINLLSNDLAKFDEGLIQIHDLWGSPLRAVIFFTFIYMEIGSSSFVGLLFLAGFIPIKSRNDFHICQKIIQSFTSTQF